MAALRILTHFVLGLSVVYAIFILKTKFGDDPCPKIVAKEYANGPLLGPNKSIHFVPVLGLFPREISRLIASNAPVPLLKGLDEFVCSITPVFTGALEDVWLTTVVDFFLPLFSAVLIWMSIESVLGRKGSGGLALLFVKAVPLVVLLGQIGTIALFMNVLFIPAWILIQRKTTPVAPALDQSGGALAYLFFGLVIYSGGLLGQSREMVLWGVTFFQFAPVVMCFLYWRPLSWLTSLPFNSFLGEDRVKALDRLYTVSIGALTALHITALVRFLFTLVNYANPPVYSLPHVAKRPNLDLDSLLHYFTTVDSPSEAPKVLALDALVVAVGLILVLVFQGRGKRDGKGNFSSLLLLPARLVVVGPGATFLSWARDYTLNVLQEPVVQDKKKN